MDDREVQIEIVLPAELLRAVKTEAASKGQSLDEYFQSRAKIDVVSAALRPSPGAPVIDARFPIPPDPLG